MEVKDHTPGTIRYFTYYIYFPQDKEEWVDQISFVHPLSWELKHSAFKDDALKCNDLLKRGETSWRDHNGVMHRIVIETEKRPRKWGKSLPEGVIK